jgi:hypothetical protein
MINLCILQRNILVTKARKFENAKFISFFSCFRASCFRDCFFGYGLSGAGLLSMNLLSRHKDAWMAGIESSGIASLTEVISRVG